REPDDRNERPKPLHLKTGLREWILSWPILQARTVDDRINTAGPQPVKEPLYCHLRSAPLGRIEFPQQVSHAHIRPTLPPILVGIALRPSTQAGHLCPLARSRSAAIPP